MELKATSLGKHLAQHPYNRVRLLHAGVEVSGEKHEYLIPFNQLIQVRCKRGIVWGELEFELPDEKWCGCTAPNGRKRSVFIIICSRPGSSGAQK